MSDELFKLIGYAEADLRSALAKLTELRAQLAALDLPDPTRVVCPDCGLSFKGEPSLAEHRYHSHGGQVPEHWVRAERLADE